MKKLKDLTVGDRVEIIGNPNIDYFPPKGSIITIKMIRDCGLCINKKDCPRKAVTFHEVEDPDPNPSYNAWCLDPRRFRAVNYQKRRKKSKLEDIIL